MISIKLLLCVIICLQCLALLPEASNILRSSILVNALVAGFLAVFYHFRGK